MKARKFAVKKIGVIERYQEFLPVTETTPIISLNEGNTPLILAEALPRELGLKNIRIYYKFEGLNPTGSFKDRGMTMAISKAVEEKAAAVTRIEQLVKAFMDGRNTWLHGLGIGKSA